MPVERVNGYDPLPVIDAFKRKKQLLSEGKGVRFSSITGYVSHQWPFSFGCLQLSLQRRDRTLAASWIPFARSAASCRRPIASPQKTNSKKCQGFSVEALVFDMFQLAIDPEASPRVGPESGI